MLPPPRRGLAPGVFCDPLAAGVAPSWTWEGPSLGALPDRPGGSGKKPLRHIPRALLPEEALWVLPYFFHPGGPALPFSPALTLLVLSSILASLTTTL